MCVNTHTQTHLWGERETLASVNWNAENSHPLWSVGEECEVEQTLGKTEK